jgi:hypothetical protein
MMSDTVIFSFICVGISVLFLLPDFFINRRIFNSWKRGLRYFLSTTALSLPIALAGLDVLVATLIVFILVMIAAWHVHYIYFGEVLSPDSLALFIKPDHFRDVVAVGLDDIRTFLPAFALIASCGGGVFFLISLSPDHGFQPWFALLAWLVLISIGARIAMRKRSRHDYPRPHMVGLFGGLHALAMAIKWGFTLPKTLPSKVAYSLQPAQDALVVVLMGESINPSRLGLFSGLPNTPRIDALMEGGPGLRASAKSGFSAAVASNSSVVGFLSGTPFPWRTEGSRSLFNLAREQGFATRYWSGQTGSPVEVLGDRDSIDDVYSFENGPASFDKRKDWHLLDKLDEKPLGSREFIFLYPKCNHAPYHCHDPSVPDDLPRRKIDDLYEYFDTGMRVFDRFVADLVDKLRKDDRRFFLFITSDHNEMLKDSDGLRGHGLSGLAVGALVPWLLLTNDTEGEIFDAFSAQGSPNAWRVVELVLKIMGVEATPEPATDAFYIGNSLPFCQAGHMKVSGQGPFRVDNYDRGGTLQATREFSKENRLHMYRASN